MESGTQEMETGHLSSRISRGLPCHLSICQWYIQTRFVILFIYLIHSLAEFVIHLSVWRRHSWMGLVSLCRIHSWTGITIPSARNNMKPMFVMRFDENQARDTRTHTTAYWQKVQILVLFFGVVFFLQQQHINARSCDTRPPRDGLSIVSVVNFESETPCRSRVAHKYVTF